MRLTNWVDASRKWPPGIGQYLVCVAGVVICANWAGGGIWLYDGRAINVSHWQPLPDPPAREVDNAVHD
jgi:hypothetical protein